MPDRPRSPRPDTSSGKNPPPPPKRGASAAGQEKAGTPSRNRGATAPAHRVTDPPPKSLTGRRVAVREGEAGTDLAAEGRVAVIVDALRASATVTSLLEAGAKEVHLVAEVEACLAWAAAHPGMLTAGERGGVKLTGFDLGNSPRDALAAPVAGKTVAMTTTTGATRIVESQGASALFIGGARNLSAVARAAADAALAHSADLVIVAAGSVDGSVEAVEDLAAASLIATKLMEWGASLEPGDYLNFPESALADLFRNCPNGRKLLDLGMGADVPVCAELDRSQMVPYIAEWLDLPDGDVVAVARPWKGVTPDPSAKRKLNPGASHLGAAPDGSPPAVL